MNPLRRIRRELRQLQLAAREYRTPASWRAQWLSNRSIRLTGLPRHRRVVGSVWAVAMVRNEADVVGHAVRHMLGQGVDRIIVADNGSTDDTPRVLAALAREDPRVMVVPDPLRAFFQAEKTSHLARWAWSRGADWIVPFDADEFWFARGQSVGDFLRSVETGEEDVGIVYADFHHMVPCQPDPAEPLSALYRLDATASFPGKVAFRSHPLATLIPGNHAVRRAGRAVSGLHIAHAQYRGPGQVARKIRQGAAGVALTKPTDPDIANHWLKAATLEDDLIAEIWENLREGRPEDRLNFKAVGPMVDVRPLLWSTWDPDGEIPIVPPMQPDK